MIDKGDRIYATEALDYGDAGVVPAGGEGTVLQLTGDDCCDLMIEWDARLLGGVDSGSVALVPDRVSA